MKTPLVNMLVLVFALFATLGARAQDQPIGYVKTVAGEASITTAGARVKAEVGTPVYQGSLLQTGGKSSMGVTFKDETVMSFGADTTFSVDEYLYAPAQGKLKLGSKLSKGSLNYVSGVIAKLKPDAVSIATPTGVIGVRGTQFLVKVED
ncbi:FecR domain-containing protein [Uliginosibacterium sp. H3]|uniref:FecR domain-containing protein n=1 Tax=Uliginosibacterium silvisoli TaxID=3114758 RepID=A0ABU6K0Z3_9RHOO|nr:FecR domain-containing protein [Uliginosibacterium sp. H3]